MMSDDNRIVDDSDLKKYRTEIPNIICDLGLTGAAQALYLQLKRTCGANGGVSWKGTKALAKSLRVSTGQITSLKKQLWGAGLINIEIEISKRGYNHHITIVDIWEMNLRYFMKDLSLDEIKTKLMRKEIAYPQIGCSNNEKGSSIIEDGCSDIERRNKPIEERTKEEDSAETSSSSVTSTCTTKQPPSVKREWQVGDWVYYFAGIDSSRPGKVIALATGKRKDKVQIVYEGTKHAGQIIKNSFKPNVIIRRYIPHPLIDDWQPKTTCRLLSPTVYERRTTIDDVGFENAEDYNPYLEIMANEMWDMGLHGEALIGDRTQTTHRARVALKNLRVWDEQRPIRVAELKAFVPWHKREAKKKGHHHSLGGGEISSSFGTFRKTHDCDGKPISSAPVSDENSGKHPNSVGDFPVFGDDGQYVGWVDDDLMIEYKDGKREKYELT
jgi:hypothetical protein